MKGYPGLRDMQTHLAAIIEAIHERGGELVPRGRQRVGLMLPRGVRSARALLPMDVYNDFRAMNHALRAYLRPPMCWTCGLEEVARHGDRCSRCRQLPERPRCRYCGVQPVARAGDICGQRCRTREARGRPPAW